MLRSTFAGFSVAHLAMAASQNALDVVGQNVSNINTVGYTRQRLDQISVSPTGHSMMNSKFSVKVGQGVMATGVSQIRDPFLDIQYRTQLAEVGTVDAMDTILDRIGDVFDETSSTAIREALNNVVSQLQNMARPDTAGQDTYDTLVRSAMEGLLNLFHERANDITDIQEEYVSRIQGTEGQKIEGYLSKIVELNEAIKNSNILGSPALELNDQRNQLIDELATYLPIDVTYEDQNVGGNITVDTLKITFTDSNGVTHTLIDDDQRGTVNITSNNGMPPLGVEITGVGGAATDVTDALGNGVLKGYADMLNKEGIFDGTDTKGVGFYGSYFDTFVHEFATTLNQLNDDGTGTKFLFETSDGSATFTAENIRISQGWMDGSVSVTTTKGGGDTAYENVQRMINAITSDVHDITTPGGDTVFSGNFLDAYDFLQNTQAAERSSTSTILANRTAVLSQIADSKDSISAISLDEEVMNLMKYQQSYNAAARLMTTLDEALDTLINNTGVVGR
ncbi:MAG TPA: flagellar hook-associated protein FlgK [Candidatus Mediterraneibacter pullistercoris]|nr:flagellar hook-associated protein FlgK [Candidatus Mediterraneibacter pullistercoris]